MGDARRRRLMARKKGLTVGGLEEKLVQKRDAVLKFRKEYDLVAKPWRKHLLDFADEAGPQIFPEDDPEVAGFLIDRMVRATAIGQPMTSEDDVSVLAALLDPFILKKPDVLKAGFALLQARVLESIDKTGASADELGAAVPRVERDVALILGAIYAERMLGDKYPDGVYVPFREIDFGKHMKPREAAIVGKAAMNAFLQDEASLKGDAALARDAFNALGADEQKQYIEIALSLPRPARETIIRLLKGSATAFQHVFDASVTVTLKSDPRIGKEVAGLSAFAVAKLIMRELTLTEEDILKATEPSPATLLQMESALTGKARVARMTYSSLTEADKNEIDSHVDGMPQSVRDNAVQWVKPQLDITALQQMIDQLVVPIREGHLKNVDVEVFAKDYPEAASDYAFVLAYVVAKKIVGDAIVERVSANVAGLIEHLPKDEQRSILHEMTKELKQNDALHSQTRIWDDTQLTQVGVALWEKTYKLGGGDTDAALAACKIAESWARERHEDPTSTRLRIVEDITCFAAKWAVHAFQRITTTHTYAAALMCSDADKAVLSDIELQWSAFMVCLPNGLLSYVDEGGIKREYNRILVGSYDKSASLILLNQHGDWTQPNILSHYGTNIADVLFVDEIDDGNIIIDDSVKDKVQRIATLARRLVAGLLLALQTKTNFKSVTHAGKASKKGRLHEEPAHRVVFVGGALKIDCRPAVTRFIEHGRSNRGHGPNAAPSFQTLVRGHFRRQVCGTGRRDRKILWISPFWRGGEDLPILTRPKRVSI